MQHSKRWNMTGWALMVALLSQQLLAAKQAPIFDLNEQSDDSPPSITQSEAQQIVSLACSTELSLACFDSSFDNELDWDDELVDVVDEGDESFVASATSSSGKAVTLTSSELNSVESGQPASAVDVGDAISLVLGAMTMLVASFKLNTTSAEPTEQNNQQESMLGYSGSDGGTLRVTDVWLLDGQGTDLNLTRFDQTFKTMQQFFSCINKGQNDCDDTAVLRKISDIDIDNTITYHFAAQLKNASFDSIEDLPSKFNNLKKHLDQFLPEHNYDIWLYPELDKDAGSFTQIGGNPVDLLIVSIDAIPDSVKIKGIIIENEGLSDPKTIASNFNKDAGEKYEVALVADYSNLNLINTGIDPYDYILGELYDFDTKDSAKYKVQFPSEKLWKDFYTDKDFFEPFSSNKDFDNDKAVFVYSAYENTTIFNVGVDPGQTPTLTNLNGAIMALQPQEGKYKAHVGLYQLTDFLSPDSHPVFPDLSDELDAII